MGALEIIVANEPEPAGVILVVEDEVLIRLDVSDFLRGEGFDVVEAASADEAIAVMAAGEHVSLVFTDVQMPGSVDGLGLVRWIRRHRPGVPVIVTSGLARDRDLAPDLADLAPVEQKPYSESALIRRIRRRLALDD